MATVLGLDAHRMLEEEDPGVVVVHEAILKAAVQIDRQRTEGVATTIANAVGRMLS